MNVSRFLRRKAEDFYRDKPTACGKKISGETEEVTLQEGTAYVIVEEAKMFLWLEIDFIPVYFEGYYGTGIRTGMEDTYAV